MKILGIVLENDQVAAIERAMLHELADPRGYTWYNHVAARAVVYEGFPEIWRDGRSVAAHAAARVLNKASRKGVVRHIGSGRWQRTTSLGT